MAIARVADHLFLIDRTGVIVDEYGPQYGRFELPIIDGLIDSPVTSKAAPDPGRVHLAARFVDAMASAPGLRRRLSQVDLSESRNVRVLLEGELGWLHLGDEAFVDRLRSYLEIAAALQERFPEIDYVDLRFYPRIFVADGKGRREARR
jgi:hypothetical protein